MPAKMRLPAAVTSAQIIDRTLLETKLQEVLRTLLEADRRFEQEQLVLERTSRPSEWKERRLRANRRRHERNRGPLVKQLAWLHQQISAIPMSDYFERRAN